MPTTTGTFDTPHASKYLQQLCKHFGHKREARFDETRGEVTFDFAVARMQAAADRLTIAMDYADAADMSRARSVIDKHLQRFAFREGFTAMDWS